MYCTKVPNPHESSAISSDKFITPCIPTYQIGYDRIGCLIGKLIRSFAFKIHFSELVTLKS